MMTSILFKRCVWVGFICTVLCITGCKHLVPYSFAENERETASIIFTKESDGGVRLVDCDGIEIPEDGKKKDLQQITFPAGRPLNLRVYIQYDKTNRKGYRRRGIFKCPPLEAGREYKLWYHRSALILTDGKVGSLRYFWGMPLYETIYEQAIPELSDYVKQNGISLPPKDKAVTPAANKRP